MLKTININTIGFQLRNNGKWEHKEFARQDLLIIVINMQVYGEKMTNAHKRRENGEKSKINNASFVWIHFIHYTQPMNVLFIIYYLIINSIELYDSFHLQLVRLQVIKLDVIFSKRNRRIQMF